VGSFIFGYIAVSIWRALLGDSPETSAMVTYVMVNQAGVWITMFLPYGAFLFQKVNDGTIAFDVLRPCGLIYMTFFEMLGHVFYNFVFRYIPIFCLGFLILGVELPALNHLLPYILSLFFGFVICYFLNYFVGLWALKFLNITGGQAIYYTFMNFFNGCMIPAEYYPGILKQTMPLTPFAGTSYIPTYVYLGRIPFLSALAIQGFWILILGCLAYVLTVKVQKTLQIQGG